jgi:hypothetical protein
MKNTRGSCASRRKGISSNVRSARNSAAQRHTSIQGSTRILALGRAADKHTLAVAAGNSRGNARSRCLHGLRLKRACLPALGWRLLTG